MKILIVGHSWNKSWMPLFIQEFKKHECDVDVWDGKKEYIGNPDIVLCTWADKDYTDRFPTAKHIMMMRRFEFFHSSWQHHNWKKIDVLICCNGWFAGQVAQVVKTKTTILQIRNSIDTSLWTFQQRTKGEKIGMVCRVHPIKNLPLAAQIMLELPKSYTLHIAGPVQDPNIAAYLTYILQDRVKFYGDLDREDLDQWWEDKNYCLSTSISEGDPMNVIEAAAKGIKPIVHRWPDADNMYETFNTVQEAVEDILYGPYESERYLKDVKTLNSASNIEFMVNFILKGAVKW